MAVTPNSIVTPQAIALITGKTFVNADGTTPKTLVTAGANGAIVTGLSGCTTDTSANNVALYVDGVLIGTVRLATLTGTDGAVVARNLLNLTDLPFLKLDAAGNATLELGPASVLTAGPLVAVTAAKTLSLQPYVESL